MINQAAADYFEIPLRKDIRWQVDHRLRYGTLKYPIALNETVGG